uniref:Uncharacterized protein n=1 Tax=Arion vulgaris TaxID=1028688 RepID=A0A0B6ZFR5_9EUPU
MFSIQKLNPQVFKLRQQAMYTFMPHKYNINEVLAANALLYLNSNSNILSKQSTNVILWYNP